MSKITIGKLIEQTINGNSSAQSELYRMYKKKIDLFLLNKYGSRNDHADDVSEILIKVFENLKKYDNTKSKFDTWVYMVAKNYMIDKSRKKKPVYVSFTSNTLNSDEMYNGTTTTNIGFITTNTCTMDMIEPASYLSSPHDTLETNDSLDFISNKIGIDEFSMLTMKFKDGYSYDEIAKEFNSDESKISNKVNYTRSKIKKGEE
jgi:RNA polymerase sigma factor (sigma-70 family)